MPVGEDDTAAPLLAMTARYSSSIPRRSRARVVHIPSALEKQRAQGKPGARCTRSRACRIVSTRVSHHRSTGTPGLPCAMVLTAYFVLSPVTGLSCHRRLADTSAHLTPASGRQDHTTLPSADKAPSSTRRLHPPHPCPTSVTIAKRPSVWAGMAWDVEVIWVRSEPEYFC
jgi:hypothetical protein